MDRELEPGPVRGAPLMLQEPVSPNPQELTHGKHPDAAPEAAAATPAASPAEAEPQTRSSTSPAPQSRGRGEPPCIGPSQATRASPS